jgi:Rad3-related DNA helicase
MDIETPADLGLPFESWWPWQPDLIRKFDRPGVHVLEAATGTGKSAVAIALAELALLRGQVAYVVVSTHALQDQYLDVFGDSETVLVMKGKQEYACVYNEFTTADQCEFALTDQPPSNCPNYLDCPYYSLRDAAVTGRYIVVMTYAFFLGIRQSENWPAPDLVVFDEAHNAARHVTDHISFDFNRKTFEHYEVEFPWKEEDVLPRIRQVRAAIQTQLGRYKWFGIEGLKGEHLKRLARLERDNTRIGTFLAEYRPDWIADLDVEHGKLSVSPLWANTVAERYLWGNIPQVLFMSATIGDPREFAFELGLPEGGYDYVETPSPFPVEHRQVYFVPWGRMSGNGGEAFNENIDGFVERFDRTIDEYGVKTLVHTNSYAQAEAIYVRSKHQGRMIFPGPEDDKFEAVNALRLADDPGAILIGPVFMEGIDLPGDDCRLVIIAKVPFPDLGDKKTRMRVDARPTWLEHATSVRIVQAAGRAVRSADDWAITIVADAAFWGFLKRARFPAWFKDAIVVKGTST